MRDDQILLDNLEGIYYELQNAIIRLKPTRSIYIKQLEKLADKISTQRKILEDISIPARLICEHILECQTKNGQISLEGDHLKQVSSPVGDLRIDDFGLICLVLGELEFAWRDENYTYYFYPDKVELRAVDEKSAYRLFFTLPFNRQTVAKFPEILYLPNVVYTHPQFEKWCEKV